MPRRNLSHLHPSPHSPAPHSTRRGPKPSAKKQAKQAEPAEPAKRSKRVAGRGRAPPVQEEGEEGGSYEDGCAPAKAKAKPPAKRKAAPVKEEVGGPGPGMGVGAGAGAVVGGDRRANRVPSWPGREMDRRSNRVSSWLGTPSEGGGGRE